MFDIGFTELLVIGLVALIVVGPKRLPEVARAAGRWAARLRRFVADVKQDFDRELHNAELTELRQLKQELDETRQVMEDASGKLMQDLQAVQGGATAAPSPTIAPPAPAEPRKPTRTARKQSTRSTSRHHGRRRQAKPAGRA